MHVNPNRLLLGSLLAALWCLPVSGCKKSGGSAAPQMDETAAGQAGGDAELDPLVELQQLEGRMSALGLPTAGAKRDEAEAPGMETTGATTTAEAGEMTDDIAAEEATAPSEAHASPPATGPQPAREDQDPCADLCSLSESICSLEVRICSLAESHGGDAVYADACERAIEDCDVAGDACDGCHG